MMEMLASARQCRRDTVRRDAFTFLAGSAAGLAYAHAAYALATSKGVISQPIFLGRKWGVGLMWAEAVLWSALGLGLAYQGRRADTGAERSGR